jgi:uncharacterized repeat protein (TIGR01451 family)
VIAGKRTCLRVGQHCKRSHNARYRRYGFVCRNGRLRHRTRRRNGPSGISVVTRPVPDADLELTSLAAPATVTVGDTFAYTITVTNNGPYAAYGVKIRDPLPAAVALVSYSSGCDGSTTITCAVRDATPVVITVRADVAGQIENTVTVTSDTPDPISPNNVAAVTTVALPPPMPALVR